MRDMANAFPSIAHGVLDQEMQAITDARSAQLVMHRYKSMRMPVAIQARKVKEDGTPQPQHSKFAKLMWVLALPRDYYYTDAQV